MTGLSFRVVLPGTPNSKRSLCVARRRKRLASTAIIGASLSLGFDPGLATAQNLPTGGKVIYGTVGMSQAGKKLELTQTTKQAITTWQTFSIGAGYTVNVNQKVSNSSFLARVLGNTTSVIAGTFSSNGVVYLVNPNGIIVTPTGSVKIDRAFIASSLDISNEDFKAGRLNFAGKGASAAVVNEGTIQIKSGGYAALIGGTVENKGLISASLGRVGLGAGERATLDLTGDGFLQVAVPTKAPGTKALIEQSGKILAPGSQVVLAAAAAREAARQAVNMSGLIEAKTVSGKSGSIVLSGNDGEVVVSGTMTVGSRTSKAAQSEEERSTAAQRPVTRWRRIGATPKALPKAAPGGSIVITGRAIRLVGATLDASSATSGGSIKIGGDYQGGGTLQRSESTTIDAATTIRADATDKGNGGNVVIWSDGTTRFEGIISAVGGPKGGDGGSVEVSGKEVLAYLGVTDLSAPKGQLGTLLLDPHNITIADAGATGSGKADESYLSAQKLQEQLKLANVTILTSNPEGGSGGNITVAAPIGWTSGGRLSLEAANRVNVQAVVSPGTSGGFTTSNGAGGEPPSEANAAPYGAVPGFVSPDIPLLTLDRTPPPLLTAVEEVRFDPSWLIPEATGFGPQSAFQTASGPAESGPALQVPGADPALAQTLINTSPQSALNLLRYLDYVPSKNTELPAAPAAAIGPSADAAPEKPDTTAAYGSLVHLRYQFVQAKVPETGAPSLDAFAAGRPHWRAGAGAPTLRTEFSLQGVRAWVVDGASFGAERRPVAPASSFANLSGQAPAADVVINRYGAQQGPRLAALAVPLESEKSDALSRFGVAQAGEAVHAAALRPSGSGARLAHADIRSAAAVGCFGSASLCKVD